MSFFIPSFSLPLLLEIVKSQGYSFHSNIISRNILDELIQESKSLSFKSENRKDYPINQGKSNEVQQIHSRSYHLLNDPQIPVASKACHLLQQEILNLDSELQDWIPTEIGYQEYQANSNNWISPHRDKRSDKFLSLTITLFGSAWIKIYESYSDPPDYKNLYQIDEFLTKSNTIMFLRAPGWKDPKLNKQVIHEVLPPLNNEKRIILNLRCRETKLKQPFDLPI